MKEKKAIEQFKSLRGFTEKTVLVGKKGRTTKDYPTTLSINNSGRLTIPCYLFLYYNLETTHFNIAINENKNEAAILFHNDKNIPGAKKIIRFKNSKLKTKTTAYLGIGPQLRAFGYTIRAAKFEFHLKSPKLLILKIYKTKSAKV